MDVGIHLCLNNHTIDPATVARCAEELGFESLWVPDHPVMPLAARRPDGSEIAEEFAHVADPLITLAIAAGATKRLKLGSGICNIVNRHPLITALQAATIDCFSEGRLLFGVGCGWSKAELDAMGADFAHRHSQLAEYVAAMREAWRHPEGASFDGRWVSFPPLRLHPRSPHEAGPRVLLGVTGPTAPQRVAAWADGWLPVAATPQELVSEMARLRSACEEVGRDLAELDISVFSYDSWTDRAAAQELLAGYSEAGANRVVLVQGQGGATGADGWATWPPAIYERQLERVAQRFL
jgi:probable F420-dependent oxidoreductase